MHWTTVFLILAIVFWLIWFIIFQGLVRVKKYFRTSYRRNDEEPSETVEEVEFKNWFFFIIFGTIWIPVLNVIVPHVLCGLYLGYLVEDGSWELRIQEKKDNVISKLVVKFISWCNSGI